MNLIRRNHAALRCSLNSFKRFTPPDLLQPLTL
jgi:hypothetical protein